MPGYFYLAIAIAAEVLATTSMKAIEGFNKPLPLLLVVGGYGIAFWMLTLVVRTIPVGIAYAIWAGLGIVLVSIALAPPVNVTLGAVLLLIGGLSMGMSPMSTVAVDIAGRHMSGTSSGLLDAHGYAYAGAQALIFAAVLDMAGSPWPIVFLAMAVTRVVSGLMISRVKV